jgi:hypothetical protein
VYAGVGGIYTREELMLFRRVFESAMASLPLEMRTDEIDHAWRAACWLAPRPASAILLNCASRH